MIAMPYKSAVCWRQWYDTSIRIPFEDFILNGIELLCVWYAYRERNPYWSHWCAVPMNYAWITLRDTQTRILRQDLREYSMNGCISFKWNQELSLIILPCWWIVNFLNWNLICFSYLSHCTGGGAEWSGNEENDEGLWINLKQQRYPRTWQGERDNDA